MDTRGLEGGSKEFVYGHAGAKQLNDKIYSSTTRLPPLERQASPGTGRGRDG